ncbi:3'(2'),5'-bisphosphate nucleotidase CysQ [Teredinibacter sp. KSP-S5-2]|uniref:3'(2'),5'-bisphosphate nucleotidase CysQ family protein n=1 Tax=Teredinibacter sp. KSP-S5-2 TaxID=3034506 RepID=UPI0029351E54|nr:inositol monophosphatase family protein [Teredinibacter sp. KSP-S5-2]WNO07807.1 inositol monophosphatase family protein [Teredinibacter sp. KSP-S5-2]
MTLSTHDLDNLLQHAIDAAVNAGQFISQFNRQELEVNAKQGGDTLASQVVSNVDIQSQKIIEQYLQPSCEQYDIALLGEESDNEEDEKQHARHSKAYFWAIDPIDGTLSFIDNTPGYSVSIALVAHDGTPVLGVVFNPVDNTLYSAQKGKGVFKNNAPWQFENNTSGKLTLAIDRSFTHHAYFEKSVKQLTDYAKRMGLQGLNIINTGGAVMNAIWALEYAPACYFKYPKVNKGGGAIWDFAATACIYAEADAYVSDIHGQPLNLNDSLFMNHCGVIYASDKHLAENVQTLYQTCTTP